MSEARVKVLKAMRRRPQRYDRRRALCQGVSLAILIAVPLSGLARVDLATGHHRLLFAHASPRQALAGVIVAIAAMYVVTFSSNVVAGRLFCGWGCPVAQVARFGENLDMPRLAGRDRMLAHLRGASFSVLLTLALLAWWVDLGALWTAAPSAVAWTSAALLAGVATAWAHARLWQWGFCKSACPIGVYYSFVSPAKWFGVRFDNGESSCVECNACDHVCPVDLAPRELMRPIAARTGLSISDAPGRNHCLECGDCVRACEWMIAARGAKPVPLTLGYHAGRHGIVESNCPV